MIYFADIFVYFKQTCDWLLSCSAHHSGELISTVLRYASVEFAVIMCLVDVCP